MKKLVGKVTEEEKILFFLFCRLAYENALKYKTYFLEHFRKHIITLRYMY